MSVTSFLARLEILRASDLIAVVPRRPATRSEGRVIFDPPLDVPGFTKTAARHERTHRAPERKAGAAK